MFHIRYYSTLLSGVEAVGYFDSDKIMAVSGNAFLQVLKPNSFDLVGLVNQ